MSLFAAISPPQIIVSWALLGVLCAWMVFCAFLALRPQNVGKREEADLLAPAGTIPALISPVPRRPVAAPVEMTLSGVSAGSSEQIGDVSSPVA